MHLHGRPYWGVRIQFTAGALVDVISYELDGEDSYAEWIPYQIYNDPASVYIPPALVSCGYGKLIGPDNPAIAPDSPIRLYYSHSGNHNSWQLVDSADYSIPGADCIVLPSVRWATTITIGQFTFGNATPYLNLPSGFTYLLFTEADAKYAASRGLPVKVIGVTPV